jgi:hypothetical protein
MALYDNDDPRPELRPADAAEMGGLFGAHLVSAMVAGDADEAEKLYRQARDLDGGRSLVAGLANITANAVLDMLAVMRTSGRYKHIPTLDELMAEMRSQYQFAGDAWRSIEKIPTTTTEGESK